MNLTLKPRRELTQSEAMGCLMANLMFPGSGSLLAGHRSGYTQMIFATTGLIISAASSVNIMAWYAQNWSRISDPAYVIDPSVYWHQLWLAARWPLAGMGLFMAGFFWALISGLRILGGAQSPAPPPLNPPNK